MCDIWTCSAGYDDCDRNASTGCEVNLLITTAHCGYCTNNCNLAHATSACVNGTCVIASCNVGYVNCDNITSNGCEVDVLTSTSNCGYCGHNCTCPHATAVCTSGVCAISPCDTGYADCDLTASSGCEVNIFSVINCGSCGNICSLPNAISTCPTGTCEVLSCLSPYGDCDGIASNGCEANLQTSASTCGTCAINCNNLANVNLVHCISGSCSIATCDSEYYDCDGTVSDGCEVNLYTTNNCGSCGSTCSSRSHSSVTCPAGTCQYSCNSGYADCNGSPTDGCETDITTSSHCGSCSNDCNGNNCNCGWTGCSCGGCFHGDEPVLLVNGEYRKVKNLLSGDRVYSLNEQNRIVEDEIIMMLHLDPNLTTEFCTIETVMNESLSVTCDHYMIVHGQKERYIRADRVKHNDMLYVHTTQNSVKLVAVKSVRRDFKIGYYTPKTFQGTLIVNGIATSCYVEIVKSIQQETIHFVLAPLRWYYRVLKQLSIQQPFKWQPTTRGYVFPINILTKNRRLILFLFQTSIGYQKMFATVLITIYFIRRVLKKFKS
ncbi:unnamed protein product [Didymodactylos carnosus]|uniref:Hint domain-containing protein n=1 Tax=Didymodactylos carnosus TaxID=1234261 RepID=A0A8S2EWE2_9BILA|nr:unnamed protein product [Didymodactylos carnosus]CAF4143745.1 unnamed protein product [Didymodactylos carnosus]